MMSSTDLTRWGLQVLPDVLVVRIFGDLKQDIGDLFEKVVERALRLNHRKVILDFSEVDSIDSLGLVLCGYGLYHFRQLGIPVALVRPPATLLPVLQGHGMDELPEVFLHEQDASMLN